MVTLDAPGQLALLPDDGSATRASRSDTTYRTHAYHTKVPPGVVAHYIERNCPPEGVVLDPFCGSGMTGVGALMTGRRAQLSDLSPAAVHIAANYTSPCDRGAFQSAVTRVLERVGAEIAAMYQTEVDGAEATIEYLVWSDIRGCPVCGHKIVLWDVRHQGLRGLCCPACGHRAPKGSFSYLGERAVEASLSAPWASGRIVRSAEAADLEQPVEISDDRWYPTDPFDRSRPMWRKSHEQMGITSVDGFFSARNLAALAALWWAAGHEQDERLRSALRFSITAVINRASRRYQWNAKRPTNVLGGTLYISSLRYEWNVLSLWRRKVAAVDRLLASGLARGRAVAVRQASATRLPVPSGSIDYCFTDPPFGAHIVYSDVSLLWEAWLGHLTDRDEEAIMVSGGDKPKGVAEYHDLLYGAFSEIRRVLKLDGRATVVFQATDESVWEAIISAAEAAGLFVAEASTMHKGQPSFKQVKGVQAGERVAHTDVVLTFASDGAACAVERPDLRSIVSDEMQTWAEARNTAAHVGHLYAVVAAAQIGSGQRPLSFEAVSSLVAEIREPLALR
jgi:16S rRNA G966 N2-methylase RsmD